MHDRSRHRGAGPALRAVGALAAVPALAAGAWIAWSRLAIDHRQRMPHAVSGRRHAFGSRAGGLSLYASDERAGRPLLLIHSVNAAASAYEVRPLYEHYRTRRPVFALDLPGFGFSERSDRIYSPQLMADAIRAATDWIVERHGGPIDAVALSLSCAYLARAALEQPDDFATLGLISPVGFDARLSGEGPPRGNRGSRISREIAAFPLWGRPLFDLLVSRPSMRFFLEKTWGSRRIDEGLFVYDQVTAHQPGAEHAPFSFLSGYLFPEDTTRLYERLRLPVWMVHGTRGDFVDYRRLGAVSERPIWRVDELDTGAFPHFERPETVTRRYDTFLRHAS